MTEPRFDTISFLTDYGTGDEFVCVVKSVIRQIAPSVDLLSASIFRELNSTESFVAAQNPAMRSGRT